MSSDSPAPSDAARLAAVCNRLRYGIVDSPVAGGPDEPDEETKWMPYRGEARLVHEGEGYSMALDPGSLDDLAQIVAALTPEQRGRFDGALEIEVWDRDSGGSVVGREFYPRSPSETLTAPRPLLLAALEFAVGIGVKA